MSSFTACPRGQKSHPPCECPNSQATNNVPVALWPVFIRPLESTTDAWWRMVQENNIDAIVMITGLTEKV